MIVQNNAPRRLGWLFSLSVFGVLLLAALFVIKTSAASAQKHEQGLERALEREVQEIRMLKAEIAYLESPDRIARLAEAHVELSTTESARVVELDDLYRLIPVLPAREVPETFISTEGGVEGGNLRRNPTQLGGGQ